MVSGATAALDIIATALCDPGEAIAVPVPYYGALDTDLTGRSGAMLLPVDPGPDDMSHLAAVVEAAWESLDARPVLVSADETPIPYSGPLEDAWLPSVERIGGELRRLAEE